MITLFYDNQCTLCISTANHMKNRNPTHIEINAVLDSIDQLNEAGINYIQAMTYVYVQDEDGQFYHGMAAVRLLLTTASIWFAPFLYLPLIKQLSDLLYPWVAYNRYRCPKWLIRWFYGKVVEVNHDTTMSKHFCNTGQCFASPKDRAKKLQMAIKRGTEDISITLEKI